MNALWPAGWSAEAFTMNRTIATKMIVMSNEFRTRGSMPGAIRSETITRSSRLHGHSLTSHGWFVSANLTPAAAVRVRKRRMDKPNPG